MVPLVLEWGVNESSGLGGRCEQGTEYLVPNRFSTTCANAKYIDMTNRQIINYNNNYSR